MPTSALRAQALEGQGLVSAIKRFQAGELEELCVSNILPPNAKQAAATAAAAAPAQVSYADAGVSIAAGDDLVDAIKPACKSTKRPVLGHPRMLRSARLLAVAPRATPRQKLTHTRTHAQAGMHALPRGLRRGLRSR